MRPVKSFPARASMVLAATAAALVTVPVGVAHADTTPAPTPAPTTAGASLADMYLDDTLTIDDGIPVYVDGVQVQPGPAYAHDVFSPTPNITPAPAPAMMLADGDTPATDAENNTGVADTGPSTYQPPADAQARVQAKKQIEANITAGRDPMTGVAPDQVQDLHSLPQLNQTAHGAATAIGHAATPHATAKAYALKPVIHYEGEGNGNKKYTCGPSSTRNLVHTLTGKDYGELQFEKWEKTSPHNGTYIGNIADTLNTHFGKYDKFIVHAPASPAALLAQTKTSVGTYGHEVIQNVATENFPHSFWGNHKARHYDGLFGWDDGAQKVWVSEEWSPTRQGWNAPYKDPYGKHLIPVQEDFKAMHSSPTGQVVG